MRREGKKLARIARVQARGQLRISDQEHDPDGHATDSADDADLDEALAAFGLVRVPREEPEGETPEPADPSRPIYLWPCNLRTFSVWQAVQTQWVEDSFGVRVRLDYSAVTGYIDRILCEPESQRQELFGLLQAMELAAIAVYAGKRST